MFSLLCRTDRQPDEGKETPLNPLSSLELRWFLEIGSFEAVLRWFREKLPGSQIDAVDERDDIYLYQPGVEDTRIKLREGRLEIKWRELAEPYHGAHGVEGQLEGWIRWSYEDPGSARVERVESFLAPNGPWTRVAKRRRQRKYLWEKGNFTPAPTQDFLQHGAAVEVTTLELDHRRSVSVLVEAFAPDRRAERQLLDEAVDGLMRDYPTPLPRRDKSYGYPRWLGMFVAP